MIKKHLKLNVFTFQIGNLDNDVAVFLQNYYIEINRDPSNLKIF